MTYKEVNLSHITLKQLGYTIKDDDSEGKRIITKDGKEVTNLQIPSTFIYEGINYKITSVYRMVFYNYKQLQSIILPNSITKIEEQAFCNCESLKYIEIPNSVTEIEKSAFWYCKNLDNVNIPNSIKKIKADTFNNCKSLKNIKIPDSVTEIEESAFWHCKNLDVIIPETVQKIGKKAFWNCKKIHYTGKAKGKPWGAELCTPKNKLLAKINFVIGSFLLTALIGICFSLLLAVILNSFSINSIFSSFVGNFSSCSCGLIAVGAIILFFIINSIVEKNYKDIKYSDDNDERE